MALEKVDIPQKWVCSHFPKILSVLKVPQRLGNQERGEHAGRPLDLQTVAQKVVFGPQVQLKTGMSSTSLSPEMDSS